MAFSTAITGLKASQTELDVTGNNIANASTVGFKSSRTEFGDIFSQVVVGAGSTNTAGNGVTVNDIAQDFTAGTIEFTNNNLDLAIDGSGFFQLRDSTGQSSYTRAGGFELDRDGFVVTKTGKNLQGYGLDSQGNLEPVQNMQVDQRESEPNSTKNMDLSFNINSEADPSRLNHPYSPEDPSTYTFSTTQRAFDSLGDENTIKFDFVEWGPYRDQHSYTIDNTNAATNSTINFLGNSITITAGANSTQATTEIMTAVADPSFVMPTNVTSIEPSLNGQSVVVLFDADAGNVDPLELNPTDDDTQITSATDVRFTAGEVQEVTIDDTVLPLAANSTIQVGGVTLTLSGNESDADDIVSLIQANLNQIQDENPDVLVVEPREDVSGTVVGFNVLFDPEAGNVNDFAINDNTSGLFSGDVAATTRYQGDQGYRGLYQMYAYLNSDPSNLLDISGLSNDTDEDAPYNPGSIIIRFSPENGTLTEINGRTVTNIDAVPGIFVKGADATITDPGELAKEENAILLDLTNTTQFASDSIVKTFAQDGYTKGDLIGVSFGEDGTMTASFSNGQVSNLGVVALATFENQNGLQPSGNTEWTATLKSGQPIINPPGTGLNGSLRSSALEQSNVDLSEELVALIEAQRNFQANSKTLQTENSITQTILQIS